MISWCWLLVLCTFLGVTRYVVTDADPTAWATAAVVIAIASGSAMALSERWQVKVAVSR